MFLSNRARVYAKISIQLASKPCNVSTSTYVEVCQSPPSIFLLVIFTKATTCRLLEYISLIKYEKNTSLQLLCVYFPTLTFLFIMKFH